MKDPVVIVGGGLSGLAAAVELTSQHIPVILFEQKPKLGGRAYSFVDATTGDVIDNGQHVLIAGYERTMRFLERIGTSHLLNIQDQLSLSFHHPQRGFCEIRLPKLPSPLHFLLGILSTHLFSIADKMRLIRAGASIQFDARNSTLREQTIEQWLDSAGQSAETKRSFWEPLAISIMNEHIAKASAKVFVDALRHAFLGGWKNSALAIPSVGLSELYVEAAATFLEQHGARVSCNADVVGLEIREGMVRGMKLRDNSDFECEAVILAVPHYRLKDIYTGASPSLSAMDSTPIVSVHLWFDKNFMQQELIGVIGRRVQWVFNKRKISRDAREDGYLSCVISGAEKFVDLSNEELIRIAIEDLQQLLVGIPSTPKHSVVIREKRATFSCTPETEKLRPDHACSIPNLFLAGDWTNTGLPATIEGAIVSGENCAKLVLGSW